MLPFQKGHGAPPFVWIGVYSFSTDTASFDKIEIIFPSNLSTSAVPISFTLLFKSWFDNERKRDLIMEHIGLSLGVKRFVKKINLNQNENGLKMKSEGMPEYSLN